LNQLGSIHPPYYSTIVEEGNKAHTIGILKLNSTITTQSMQFESETPVQLNDEGGQDEECFIVESKKALKIFLPKQIAVVKNLLGKTKNVE
jgi:hypothetical protein